MARVSVDDLTFASNWLASYEPSDDGEDDNDERVQRLLAWLGAEIARRDKGATVRKLAKKHGVSEARVRQVLAQRTSTPKTNHEPKATAAQVSP